LIPLDEAISTTEEVIGLMLTHMSGMAARCGGNDLQLRRRIEQVVYETRVAMSEAASKLADPRRAAIGRRNTMTDVEMTDAEVARSDRACGPFHCLIATTAVDPASLCADDQRRGLRRIAATLDTVPFVTFCNLANINTAMRGGLLDRPLAARPGQCSTAPNRDRSPHANRA
jgi:hypothetical protein